MDLKETGWVVAQFIHVTQERGHWNNCRFPQKARILFCFITAANILLGRWLNSMELQTCCVVPADTCEQECVPTYNGEIFRKLRVIRGFRFLHPEDGTDRLPRNVGKKLPLLVT